MVNPRATAREGTPIGVSSVRVSGFRDGPSIIARHARIFVESIPDSVTLEKLQHALQAVDMDADRNVVNLTRVYINVDAFAAAERVSLRGQVLPRKAVVPWSRFLATTVDRRTNLPITQRQIEDTPQGGWN